MIIVLVCVAATVHLFDWRTIGLALTKLHVGLLLGGGIPLLLATSAMRGWRWLVVLGIRTGRTNLWQSFCANGAAAGLASLTPFQIGEVIKIRMIPDHHGKGWRLGVSAFFLERLLDLGTLCSIGLGGLAIHLGYAWLAPLTLLLPLGGCLVLSLLCRSIRLPEKLLPYTEVLRHAPRVVMAAVLTIPLWLLYVVLWWVATHAMNVPLDLTQAAILLGGVMLVVVASMTPGGLGVSELGSRSVLLWLGVSAADAEIGAIAIRLLTPMMAVIGLACLVPLLGQLRRKK
ncbi:lysylphosphatidylglycerol synthase transmembrane domain-containing protein [Rhodanobacter umsongensis]|uniref:Lysylphosphatidylglycerol synthase transmembrane domain-containing protein n=1 Tax=Rhodanobacter umsongensis TaxID=633153 RepID=A0ABW0JMD9_9GAMM